MRSGDCTALVLAGGGARGAYEVGALSALMPALGEEGRPGIVVGTSVGALNAAYLAAGADRPVAELTADGLSLWRGIRFSQVLKPLVSLPELERLGAYLGEVIGLRGVQALSLLDPSPLTATLAELIDFAQIHDNVQHGRLRAAAVVASSAATDLSVVFHDGGPDPPIDARRGIEYLRTELSEDHVRASAAIPLLFPAVAVTGRHGRQWYFDGGTRLNTPIKPALELGAQRVIVIALNALRPRRPSARERRPDALDGAGELLQAVLVDPLVGDLHTLATINEILGDAARASPQRRQRAAGRRVVPYMLIAPQDPDEIGRLAAEVYRRHYAGPLDLARSPSLVALGRLLSVTSSPTHAELLSYLFFAGEFADALIELGRRDAELWLRQPHDDGLWQLGSL